MRLFYLIILSLFSVLGFSQENFNLELVANVDLGESGNDIWGWVDEQGTEFAIIGARTSTRIFSLADPANPVEVISIPGSSSTWRDIKTWGNYIYVVADSGNDGLLVIDMSNYQDTIPHYFWQPALTIGEFSSTLQRSHNIYIDENGYGYLAGANSLSTDTRKRGFIILDLFTDPWNPNMVAFDTTNYSHDVFVRGDTVYSSEIFAGQLALYDVSDKSNIKFLGSTITSFNFTHNAWPSDDGKYVFTTDERSNAFVDAYDISDVDNIQFLDRFQPLETKDQGVIPHNTHYLNGYLITSWYTDGVVIIDANKPDNLVKVGSYDTYSGSHGGFSGCWGAYPFLPSGLVLASDINSGLYVLSPNYQRAYYLDGLVTDNNSGDPINNVEIILKGESEIITNSDAIGQFSLGQANGGSYEITFSHPEYFPETRTVFLLQGECVSLDVPMQRKQEVTASFSTVKSVDGTPIANGSVVLIGEDIDYEVKTDQIGIYEGVFFAGEYQLLGGAWGYLHKELGSINLDGAGNYTIELEPGYQDDFIFDLGWEVSGDAIAGIWERGIPNVTFLGGEPSNVDRDIEGDLGNLCYITGNGGMDVGFDDVDGGLTRLTSNIMDLSEYENPIVEYYLWFINVGGNGEPNDSLVVYIDNGVEMVMLEKLKESATGWREKSSFYINEYIDITSEMRLVVEIGDDMNTQMGHIVEGGLDAFFVRDETTSPTLDLQNPILVNVFPNPSTNEFTIEYELEDHDSGELNIYDLLGRPIYSLSISNPFGKISFGSELPSGSYILQLTNESGQSSQLIIKN